MLHLCFGVLVVFRGYLHLKFLGDQFLFPGEHAKLSRLEFVSSLLSLVLRVIVGVDVMCVGCCVRCWIKVTVSEVLGDDRTGKLFSIKGRTGMRYRWDCWKLAYELLIRWVLAIIHCRVCHCICLAVAGCRRFINPVWDICCYILILTLQKKYL